MFYLRAKRVPGLRKLALAVLTIFGGFSAGVAHADSPDRLAFQVGAASQYVGKGLDKSDGSAAVSGAVHYTHGAFYGDAFASTARLSAGGDSEVILTLGVQQKFAGFKIDLSAADRSTPGTRKRYDSHYQEYQADISRTVGRLTAGVKLNYTPDGYGPTRQAWWNEARVAWKLSDGDKLTAAVGDRRPNRGVGYTAWNAGLKHRLGKAVTADLRWYDTNGHQHGEPYRGRAVVGLTLEF